MKTKKRGKTLVVVFSVVAVALVAIVILGRQYYQDRYVGTDYYTMVPLDYDVTPEPMYSSSGEEMGKGKEYKLTIFNEKGEKRQVTFNVYAPGSGLAAERELPNPGEYLFVKASKQVVNSWKVIGKTEVPEKVLALIDGGR